MGNLRFASPFWSPCKSSLIFTSIFRNLSTLRRAVRDYDNNVDSLSLSLAVCLYPKQFFSIAKGEFGSYFLLCLFFPPCVKSYLNNAWINLLAHECQEFFFLERDSNFSCFNWEWNCLHRRLNVLLYLWQVSLVLLQNMNLTKWCHLCT